MVEGWELRVEGVVDIRLSAIRGVAADPFGMGGEWSAGLGCPC